MILGLVAVSAAAGGLTAWTVSADRGGSVAYIEREVERTPALGTQFTSYQAEQYPDLTYAAENAVKAVVNIEAIQQVEMPQRRGYDPFLEFFGIPQDYGRGDGGPQYREQRENQTDGKPDIKQYGYSFYRHSFFHSIRPKGPSVLFSADAWGDGRIVLFSTDGRQRRSDSFFLTDSRQRRPDNSTLAGIRQGRPDNSVLADIRQRCPEFCFGRCLKYVPGGGQNADGAKIKVVCFFILVYRLF